MVNLKGKGSEAIVPLSFEKSFSGFRQQSRAKNRFILPWMSFYSFEAIWFYRVPKNTLPGDTA